jgi:hypothetical protein
MLCLLVRKLPHSDCIVRSLQGTLWLSTQGFCTQFSELARIEVGGSDALPAYEETTPQ